MSPKSKSPATNTVAVGLLILVILLSNHHRNCTAAGSSSSSPIKTVVVLVMENRSFDHMLGWMKKMNPEINGVDGSESNPISTSDPNSRRIFFGDQSHYVDPDPGHSFQAIREQIFGSNQSSKKLAPMNGFVQQALSMDTNMPEQVMNGFQPQMVSIRCSNSSKIYTYRTAFSENSIRYDAVIFLKSF